MKYFEASIDDTVSLVSNTDVYDKIIIDGENGFVASEFEWYEKLEYIYLNRKKMSKIVNNAREYCLKEYGCYNQTKKLDKMFDEILKEK